MAQLELPDITHLAYPRDDPGDHPGGGHCAGLPEDKTEQWVLVLDQHHRAFELLADKAVAEDDGWELSRPVLFAAHHTCEVAIKARIFDCNGQDRSDHRLDLLWSVLESCGGATGLDDAHREWASEFIKELSSLTEEGFEGRYPRPVGGSDAYCCLNIAQLRVAVERFVLELVPDRGVTQD